MSNPKAYCPNCKNEVALVAEGSFLLCPNCRHKFEQSDIDSKTVETKEVVGLMADLVAVLRVLVIFILALAGVFLVLLAFLFAACSQMGHI